MLRILYVENLNGKLTKTIHFNEDLNIITGKNGSGKTTIIKLAWFLISGNIERIPREMDFDHVYLKTDNCAINIQKTGEKNEEGQSLYEFTYNVGEKAYHSYETKNSISEETGGVLEANRRIAFHSTSIFFSTFRRLEGGFGMQPPSMPRRRPYHYSAHFGLNEQMRELSELLSVFDHKFIASISTDDIVRLLTQRYTEVSEKTNQLHQQLSEKIQTHIQEYSRFKQEHDSTQLEQAKSIIDQIHNEITEINQQRDSYLNPFTVLENLVLKIFEHEGIRITRQIIIGNEDDPVDSDKLSSGEKQMLSFLCYNAFYENVPIFIDEPEISLHVDWQRLILPTLLEQRTGNQFITATHSPFIYSQYPDKEICLDDDRGHTDY